MKKIAVNIVINSSYICGAYCTAEYIADLNFYGQMPKQIEERRKNGETTFPRISAYQYSVSNYPTYWASIWPVYLPYVMLSSFLSQRRALNAHQ
jgi:hypothetical protein